jgi:hypothetical protein
LVDVNVLELPIEIPGFSIAQYWHDRFHADPGNRWLRKVFLRLYGRDSPSSSAGYVAPRALDVST